MNRKIIDDYIEKLLEVQPPVFEQRTDDSAFLVLSAVCMSLEGIKFVIETLNSRSAELSKINHTCAISLNQTKHFISQENNYLEQDFEPVPHTLACSKEEFLNGRHYILFQDSYVKEKLSLEPLASSFKDNLETLLKSVDLAPHYDNCVSSREEIKDYFMNFLHHVIHQPKSFLVPDDQIFNVQLLGMSLMQKFSTGEVTRDTLLNLIEQYAKQVEVSNKRNKRIEQALRMAIKATNARLTYTIERKKYCRLHIITGLLARKFIEKAKEPFEISINKPTALVIKGGKLDHSPPATPQPSYLPLVKANI